MFKKIVFIFALGVLIFCAGCTQNNSNKNSMEGSEKPTINNKIFLEMDEKEKIDTLNTILLDEKGFIFAVDPDSIPDDYANEITTYYVADPTPPHFNSFSLTVTTNSGTGNTEDITINSTMPYTSDIVELESFTNISKLTLEYILILIERDFITPDEFYLIQEQINAFIEIQSGVQSKTITDKYTVDVVSIYDESLPYISFIAIIEFK